MRKTHPTGCSRSSSDAQPDGSAVALCPRCGYDLHGVVSNWTNSCPLYGTCSECGLRFEWLESLVPHRVLPRWSIEFIRDSAMLRGICLTVLHAVRPHGFWRALRMEHPIQWRRLAVMLFVVLAMAYVVLAISNGLAVWMSVADDQRWATRARLTLRLTESPARRGIRAALLPLSDADVGWYALRGSIYPLATTRSLFVGHWMEFTETMGLVVWTTWFVISAPLVFAALPISRRRAKVRWSHVLRIAAYSICLCVPAYLAWMIGVLLQIAISTGTMSGGWGGLISIESLRWCLRVVLLATLVLFLWWWMRAIRDYLRMEHSGRVAMAVVLTAFCAAWAGSYVVYPGFVSDVLGDVFIELYR